MGNNYCQLYGIVKEFCGASWAVSLKILKYFFCIFFSWVYVVIPSDLPSSGAGCFFWLNF
jgi:hypothetical protein